MTAEHRTPTWGSVVIPAHNEATVLPRLLTTLRPAVDSGALEVIVVANGCADDTADVARSFPRVRVEELAEGSKIAALNRGDEVARAFPRIYIDADVEIPLETLRRLCVALDGSAGPHGPLAGSPPSFRDTEGCHPLVRACFRARARAVGQDGAHLWGAGCYALSERGRRRFDRWPDVTGDDYWIDRMFTAEEKVETTGEPVRVRAPRTPAALLNIMARVHRGNHAIDSDVQATRAAADTASTTSSTVRALVASVRGPRSLLDAASFASFTLAGRILARRRAHERSAGAWERDDSTRAAR